MKLLSRLCFISFVTAIFSVGAFAADSAPDWLRTAAAMTPPIYDKDVQAVVLQETQNVSYDGEKIVTTENYAVKILLREGKDYAVAQAFYLASFSKVHDFNAWIIRPDGTVKSYDKKTIIDLIYDKDDVYNEGHVKMIDASDDVDAGYVFGYSVTTDDKPLFYQDNFGFQQRLPVLLARYNLTLPNGWKASSITFNHEEIKPQINGSNYVWEIRNLAPIRVEPKSPAVRNLAPRIAINYAPDHASQNNRSFADWTAVSRWGSSLHDPMVIVDDAVAVKARELTANASTELEKIRAIGTYVQNLQYISIDIGVGYGNGFIPRSSTLVLGRGYGDCKDKANLMRALLKSLKIEAYPVFIYSGDPTFVRAEWVSPNQFNHCIIAIKVSDATKTATVLDHPKLGRLLIFDATDPYTPVGDLPDYEQDSYALIAAGENGGLIKMPITSSESNLIDRNLEVNIDPDGNIKGSISEVSNGQESTMARAQSRLLSPADFNKMIEAWLTRGATGARLNKITPVDKINDAKFDLDLQFSAPNYAQIMQNRLLIFKPVIVSRRNSVFLTENKRSNPVILDSNSLRETTTFNLPQGFVIDELPDPVSLETTFGKYTTKYENKGDKIVFTRSLVTTRTTIAVDKYNSVKDFYTKIMAAEQSPVVLARK